MKYIRFKEDGRLLVVVEETETTVTYRLPWSKNPRDFIMVNKKYVEFV